jgi:protocatechuate 3,4-dioxygenase beta subunit
MDDHTLSRRSVTSLLLWGSAATLTACSPSRKRPLDGSASTPDPSDSGTGSTDTTEERDTASSGDCGEAAAWAVGGTAAMLQKDCYPSPFESTPDTCALLCETTAGPCTADSADREDVSEGLSGLPVRLLFRVLDDSCRPVPGATVFIWHTQRSGVYSGETPAGAFCYGDDPSAARALYFRGHQNTDEDGIVAFDTCFPGWYPGRPPHIHIQVQLGEDLYLTTQVAFDDALSAEICSGHEDYATFGPPDTTLATDGVLGRVDDLTPYILDTQRMADGAMLASKTIVVRASLDTESCQARGGGAPL